MAWRGMRAVGGSIRNALSLNRVDAAIIGKLINEEQKEMNLLVSEEKATLKLELVTRNLHTSASKFQNCLRNLVNFEKSKLQYELAMKKLEVSLGKTLGGITQNALAQPQQLVYKEAAQMQNEVVAVRNLQMRESKYWNEARVELNQMLKEVENLRTILAGLNTETIRAMTEERGIEVLEQQLTAGEQRERQAELGH